MWAFLCVRGWEKTASSVFLSLHQTDYYYDDDESCLVQFPCRRGGLKGEIFRLYEQSCRFTAFLPGQKSKLHGGDVGWGWSLNFSWWALEERRHPCSTNRWWFSPRLGEKLSSTHVRYLICLSFSLQNSPLFQYLHDLGHTDFEACPTASQDDEYGGEGGDLNSPDEDPQKTSVSSSKSLTQISHVPVLSPLSLSPTKIGNFWPAATAHTQTGAENRDM